MKKIVLLLLLSIVIISCDEPNVTQKSTGVIYDTNGCELEEIVIDSCQYIGLFHGDNSDWGTHKGNCNNPIHKQSKVTIIDTVEYKLIKE